MFFLLASSIASLISYLFCRVSPIQSLKLGKNIFRTNASYDSYQGPLLLLCHFRGNATVRVGSLVSAPHWLSVFWCAGPNFQVWNCHCSANNGRVASIATRWHGGRA
ncbi:hypothetical protein GALMADRAFT_876936 [Galerina marginata CBS 339.88]|uniref:Secreted protein n=1 Tax=Galerina marginata (strain CBS 339.88) TaxID=685588 RepID=A0A067TJC5_GALM3|nr:hypothetical protein GALMADRAFT_876936 [Galerina marginata CBS 339.88]